MSSMTSSKDSDKFIDKMIHEKMYHDRESNYTFRYEKFIKFDFLKCKIKEQQDRYFRIDLYYFNHLEVIGYKYSLTYVINGKVYPPIVKDKPSPIKSVDNFTILVDKKDIQPVNHISFFLSVYALSILYPGKIYYYNLKKWHIIFDKTSSDNKININNNEITTTRRTENTWTLKFGENKESISYGMDITFYSKPIKNKELLINNDFLTIKASKNFSLETKNAHIESERKHYTDIPINLSKNNITDKSTYRFSLSVLDSFIYDQEQNKFIITPPTKDSYRGIPMDIYHHSPLDNSQLSITMILNKITKFQVLISLNTDYKVLDNVDHDLSLMILDHNKW